MHFHKKYLIETFFLMVIFVFTMGSAQAQRKIELWDQDGNLISGYLRDNRRIELWDQNSQYISGYLRENGKIELLDQNRQYIWGYLRGTEIQLQDSNHNLIRGKLK